MSHVAKIKTVINSLPALKLAAQELGALFLEGKKTYEWYGRHVGDYPPPEGIKKEDLGKCSHVIHLPNCKYEIGVVDLGNNTYTLLYDFWGEGQKLQKQFGNGLKKLTQHYTINRAELLARAKGYKTQRIKADKSIKLQITGTSL